jgi:hypothetical protein
MECPSCREGVLIHVARYNLWRCEVCPYAETEELNHQRQQRNPFQDVPDGARNDIVQEEHATFHIAPDARWVEPPALPEEIIRLRERELADIAINYPHRFVQWPTDEDGNPVHNEREGGTVLWHPEG